MAYAPPQSASNILLIVIVWSTLEDLNPRPRIKSPVLKPTQLKVDIKQSITLSFTLHIYYTIYFIKNQKGFLYSIKMVRQAGLEPTVPGLKVRCLNQLSYWRMFEKTRHN